jgi:hypothetical protein
VPIERAQFAEATKPLTERIRDILSADPEKAYDVYELIGNVEGYGATAQVALVLWAEQWKGSELLARYRKALEELVSARLVETANLRGTTYYAIRRSA